MTDRFDSWPERPEAVGLHIDPLTWAEADAVWAAIRSVPDGQGWVCLPDRVALWPGDLRGPLLSAEIAGSDGSSLHVRRADQRWCGWRYRESPDGDRMKFRELVVGTVPDSARKLGYAVYWQLERGHDDVEVFRPFAARFTGWEGA